MNTDLTILVNSSDNYEDCWYPYFYLFKEFWPDCPYPIVLNTETKDFQFPGLNITCSKVGRGANGERLPWSETVLRCLANIKSDYILWTLEDLFLFAPVDSKRIAAVFKLMQDQRMSHIHLTPIGAAADGYQPSPYPGLWKIRQNHRYRISLITALWQKERLVSYMRPYENPWELEIFGSWRARRTQDTFYCISTDAPLDPKTWPIPYLFSGIVKGKWDRQTPELFRRHSLEMDFEQRGFYEPASSLVRRLQLALKLTGALWQQFRRNAKYLVGGNCG